MIRRRRVLDWTAYMAVRLLICAVQALSLETCQAWSRRFGVLAWRVLRLRRGVIEENLLTAFPSMDNARRDALAIEMWQHLLLMVAEISHAPRKLHRTNWRNNTSAPQLPAMAKRLLDKRPLVILSGHFGNFELGGYVLGLHGFPTYTVARRLDNEYLDKWVNEFRGATGQYMLEKTGVSGAIEKALENGKTIVLLGDQYAGDRAFWTEFFGKPASTHKAVAMFTLSYSAPTAVCSAVRCGEPLHIEMWLADVVDPQDNGSETASAPSLIAWYTRCLEGMIRRAPEQYWWVHRRWKGQPRRPKGRRPKAA